MFTIQIELPDVIEFKRAGRDMKLELSKLSPYIIGQLALCGFASTVGDAASAAASGVYETTKKEGAPDWKVLSKQEKADFTLARGPAIAEYGESLMLKRYDRLLEGEWTATRATVPGLTTLEERMAEVVMAKMTFEKGAKKADKVKEAWEKFLTFEQPVRDRVRKIAQGMIDADIKARQELAALDFDLGELDPGF